MASGLCRDPITDKSSSVHSSVDSASTKAEPPARPGTVHMQEANDRAGPLVLTMAPNVGHDLPDIRNVGRDVLPVRDGTHVMQERWPTDSIMEHEMLPVNDDAYARHDSRTTSAFTVVHPNTRDVVHRPHFSTMEQFNVGDESQSFLRPSPPVGLSLPDDSGRSKMLPDRKSSISTIDAGYLSANANSKLLSDAKHSLPSTDVRQGVDRDLQSFSRPTLYQEQMPLHAYGETIDVAHGFKTDEHTMYTRANQSNTVDNAPPVHALLNDRYDECMDAQRSRLSSPTSAVDHMDRMDTHSLPDHSEIQFNRAAIERAKQAGRDSQCNTVDHERLRTCDDVYRAATNAPQ